MKENYRSARLTSGPTISKYWGVGVLTLPRPACILAQQSYFMGRPSKSTTTMPRASPRSRNKVWEIRAAASEEPGCPGEGPRRLGRRFPGESKKVASQKLPSYLPPFAALPSLITECISQRASILQFASRAAGGPDPRSGAPLRNNCFDPVGEQKRSNPFPAKAQPRARGRVTDAGLS